MGLLRFSQEGRKKAEGTVQGSDRADETRRGLGAAGKGVPCSRASPSSMPEGRDGPRGL